MSGRCRAWKVIAKLIVSTISIASVLVPTASRLRIRLDTWQLGTGAPCYGQRCSASEPGWVLLVAGCRLPVLACSCREASPGAGFTCYDMVGESQPSLYCTGLAGSCSFPCSWRFCSVHLDAFRTTAPRCNSARKTSASRQVIPSIRVRFANSSHHLAKPPLFFRRLVSE